MKLKKVLHAIVNDNGFNSEKARELLEKLEKFSPSGK